MLTDSGRPLHIDEGGEGRIDHGLSDREIWTISYEAMSAQRRPTGTDLTYHIDKLMDYMEFLLDREQTLEASVKELKRSITRRAREVEPVPLRSDIDCQMHDWTRPDPFSPEQVCSRCGLSSNDEDVDGAA